jgi:hypothetical protein
MPIAVQHATDLGISNSTMLLAGLASIRQSLGSRDGKRLRFPLRAPSTGGAYAASASGGGGVTPHRARQNLRLHYRFGDTRHHAQKKTEKHEIEH